MPDTQTMLLQLVSPERVLVEEQVSEAQIPALDGYIGAMPGHAPLLSALKAGGVMTYTANGQTKTLAVYGGFVEVLPESVRVLADAAEFGSEINREKAQQRLQEAIRASQLAPAGNTDPQIALDELNRAQAAVDAASAKT
jgi:F-type H+-transporting ATPase subunit epsilon